VTVTLNHPNLPQPPPSKLIHSRLSNGNYPKSKFIISATEQFIKEHRVQPKPNGQEEIGKEITTGAVASTSVIPSSPALTSTRPYSAPNACCILQ